MHPELWQTCIDIFKAVVERPPEERSGLLDRRCDGDDALRRRVELLLKYHEETGDFIETPAFEVSPELLLDNPDALIGQHLGHYRIDAVLGTGGMGIVYLACDEKLGRKVGLKLLPQSLVADEAHLERLKREARTASALNHPNIVTIHEIGQFDATHYIATEFIEGATLRERMAQGAIPPNEALEIALQVASALSVAHAAGIVHRDIKPENIMLRPDGYVKVLDFGIAQLTEQQPTSDDVGTTAVLQTRPGLVLGTARYMSPEQTRGQTVDARSDIWSLGVVLYEMVGGIPPFAGDTPSDCIASILKTEPPPLSGVLPGVPLKFQAIVQKALRKNRDERYQTISEMLADLRNLRAGVETQNSAPQTESIVGRIKQHKRVALLAAASVIVAVGSLTYSFYRPVPAPLANEKSIAVLPFADLSGEKENAFFADGVHDEILTNLAKVADLKVISRTSVMSFRDTKRNLREIAQALGVAHIVEGSVQRAGGRIRVSAQLIDARTDTHLWAEHYNRDFADVFAIQSEIAQQIADQLRSKLSPSERAAIAERPTSDLVAYALYNQARELAIWGNWEGAEKSLARKVELLEKATQRDPNFALAYCALAKTQCALFSATGVDSSDLSRAHLELAKKAADAALRVRPDLGEAHLELARYYFYAGDFDRGRDELTVARRTLPNDSEALFIAARIDRRQNRWDDALANFRKARELDPRNSEAANWLGETYFEMRRYYELEQLITKDAASFPPQHPWTHLSLAQIKLAQGDPAAAQALLAQVPLEFSPTNDIWDTRFTAALYLRDYDAANRVIAATPAKFADRFSRATSAAGLVAVARGDKEKAQSIFLDARKRLDATWGTQVKDERYFAQIAELDAGLGRKEEAIREARRAVELKPTARDSLQGPAIATTLALVYAWTGERDRALEQLETVAKIPAGPSYGDLRFNPCWDSLRGDPRFEKMVANLKPKPEQ